MTSDSDRILADGVPIELTDGSAPKLRYTMRSFKFLEDFYGDLNAADAARKQGHVTALVTWIAAGLVHEEDLTAEQLYDVLSIDRRTLRGYQQKIDQAMDQALGPEPEDDEIPKGRARSSSTGRAGTTRRRSSSAEPTSSSGP